MYQDLQILKPYPEAHGVEVAVIVEGLQEEGERQQQQLEQLLKYHERDYQVEGVASVGTFGGNESYLRVNRRSDARIYRNGDKLKITCDIAGKPDAVLEVRGTFSDSNQDLVISFSRQAAADLGITGRVGVEMEPVAK